MTFSEKTRFVAIFLILCMSLTLLACSDGSYDDTSSGLSLDRAAAGELVERDRLITELFVGCSLAAVGDSASATAVAEGNEYRDFSRIEALLADTYLSREGGDADFFRSYPQGFEPSLSSRDGVTYAFPHASAFSDKIDLGTLTVSDSSDESRKLIFAKTASGRDVTLNAHYSDGKWLLESGLYRTLGAPDTGAPDVPAMGHGSMKSLTGSLLVITLFVSDKSTSFTSEEESAYSAKIKTAVDGLASAAGAYGSELAVTYESAYFDHVGIVGTRDIDFDIVFAETGFGTLQKFAEKNFPTDAFDNYFVFVCLDKNASVSVGCSLGIEQTQFYTGERIIVGQSATVTELSRAVLSLMGATDGGDTPFLSSLYRAYFPDDVMVSDSESASLGALTAYICGLTKELPLLYRRFLEQ